MSGKFDIPCIPKGHVREEDQKKSHVGGLEHAFHREIYQQYKGTVIPLQYERVQIPVENGISQTVFLISSWDGELPEYDKNGTEKVARLLFLQIDAALEEIGDPNEQAILQNAKEAIRIRSTLQRRLRQ